MKKKSNADVQADVDSWACKEGDFDTDDTGDRSHDVRREA